MKAVYKSYKTACFAMAKETGTMLQSHGGGWFNVNGKKIQGLYEVYDYLKRICEAKGVQAPRVEER